MPSLETSSYSSIQGPYSSTHCSKIYPASSVQTLVPGKWFKRLIFLLPVLVRWQLASCPLSWTGQLTWLYRQPPFPVLFPLSVFFYTTLWHFVLFDLAFLRTALIIYKRIILAAQDVFPTNSNRCPRHYLRAWLGANRGQYSNSWSWTAHYSLMDCPPAERQTGDHDWYTA